MVVKLIKNVFGTANDRALKRLRPTVARINALEEETKALSDEQLAARTDAYRERVANGETLESLLPEAFATVREAAWRVLGERHYDVQLMGGIVLHQGRIAEMRTGEGKTLSSTLPAYLNALTGKGVHIVTVNEYLATRDAEWMGQVFRFLGMTTSAIKNAMGGPDRKKAYEADITYATNNELGWDYLRDNLQYDSDHQALRPFNYAIIDEVDSILIDEARTPLVISGPAQDTSDLYRAVDSIVKELNEEDIEQDAESRTVNMTDKGVEKVETIMRANGLISDEDNLYNVENIALVHHMNMALRAHFVYKKDHQYILSGQDVVIIDEFTGRMTPGKRYGDGQHQAIEAKEGVPIKPENQTLASITYQNFFKLYPKLSGMTGTALTEADEFMEIYGLGVVDIPTNLPIARVDEDDAIFQTMEEKHSAVVALVKDVQKKGQPILLGTASIEASEDLAKRFKKEKIPHQILNARHHEQEADIVALAGRIGAVTIATNMAGRGTDIKLGGSTEVLLQQQLKGEETEAQIESLRTKIKAEVAEAREQVKALGGLFVIGSERHESRRIDNQLRGRSGRQGDPGASKFFISLEDYLMSVFGAQQRLGPLLAKLNLKKGHAIVHPWINAAIERAQKKVEAMHFDNRKYLLKRDDVLNEQRLVIYKQRREIMFADNVTETISSMRHEAVREAVRLHIPANSYAESWDVEGLTREVKRLLNLDMPLRIWADEDGIGREDIRDRLLNAADEDTAKRTAGMGIKEMQEMERKTLLLTLDQLWREHLLNMEYVRQGIGFRAVAQRDPINEYKSEAFLLYQELMAQLKDMTTAAMASVSKASAEKLEKEAEAAEAAREKMLEDLKPDESTPSPNDISTSPQGNVIPTGNVPRPAPFRKQSVDENNPATWKATPRNSPCPCGSGKKYKHCHGKVI